MLLPGREAFCRCAFSLPFLHSPAEGTPAAGGGLSHKWKSLNPRTTTRRKGHPGNSCIGQSVSEA